MGDFKREYMEHTIELQEQSMQFFVTGPLFDEQRHSGNRLFKNYEDACAAIERRTKARNAQKKATTTLRAIDEGGNRVVVTGIHSGTSRLLGPNSEAIEVYPDHPWVMDLLQKLKRLNQEREDTKNQLGHYSIRSRRGYGRIEADQYPAALASLEKEYDAKLAKARADAGEKDGPKQNTA